VEMCGRPSPNDRHATAWFPLHYPPFCLRVMLGRSGDLWIRLLCRPSPAKLGAAARTPADGLGVIVRLKWPRDRHRRLRCDEETASQNEEFCQGGKGVRNETADSSSWESGNCCWGTQGERENEKGEERGHRRLEDRNDAPFIWASGVHASDAAKWLGVDADRVVRVKVYPGLRVPVATTSS